jgi:hypothetical protein
MIENPGTGYIAAKKSIPYISSASGKASMLNIIQGGLMMKTKILLLSISFVVVPLFIFASQCGGTAVLGGTWSTDEKTVWVDTGGGPELAPSRFTLIFAGDKFYWYSYVQSDTEWELVAGATGSYEYDGYIMTATLTKTYDYGIGWSSSTDTYAAQVTISDNTLSYIEDRNEDEVYEDTIVFDDGVDMTDYSNDMKYIFSRQN